jgi:aryl-alcohol dehydrogenase
MQIRAAIARAPTLPFDIVECEIAEPGPGEVLVRVKACGICHTDLAVKLQHIPVPLPKVLGHEGAGVIERVGPDVAGLAEGDPVLMSFGSCGGCAECQRGSPGYCNDFGNINMLGQRQGASALRYRGAVLSAHFFTQSAFATHAIATSRNVVKVAPELPFATLAPFGCGIQTGAGAVLNTLAPPAGTAIAVFGAGAVGLAAIMAAKVVGCTTIIAVDLRNERLTVAREIGATHIIDAASDEVLNQIVHITGRGAHFSLDTTGHPAAVALSINCLRQRGCSAQVAAPPRGTRYPLEASVIVGRGLMVRGVVEGDAVSGIFIPRLIDLFRRGLLPVDKLVTFFPFDEINRAIEEMETGAVIKPVLLMD